MCALTECTGTVFCIWPDDDYETKHVAEFLILITNICFTNKLEHWYVRHNNVYCLHPWATCFDLYTGHLQALLYM